MNLKKLARVVVVIISVFVACSDPAPTRPSARPITIPNLTGLGRSYALKLIQDLDLDVRLEEIAVKHFARDVVLRQNPSPGTEVKPGEALVLFVPKARSFRTGERPFKLLTHCGLSFPLTFDERVWLPVDRAFRRTVNPPEGFHSEGFYDHGTIRRIDADTLIYTSSTGVEVEYAPTTRRGGGCD